MLWACVPSRVHTCCLLLFLYLFVRETQFYFFSFPGEVWLYQQEMQICFSFLTLCWPSFPVFLACRVYACSAVSATYFFS